MLIVQHCLNQSTKSSQNQHRADSCQYFWVEVTDWNINKSAFSFLGHQGARGGRFVLLPMVGNFASKLNTLPCSKIARGLPPEVLLQFCYKVEYHILKTKTQSLGSSAVGAFWPFDAINLLLNALTREVKDSEGYQFKPSKCIVDQIVDRSIELLDGSAFQSESLPHIRLCFAQLETGLRSTQKRVRFEKKIIILRELEHPILLLLTISTSQ